MLSKNYFNELKSDDLICSSVAAMDTSASYKPNSKIAYSHALIFTLIVA